MGHIIIHSSTVVGHLQPKRSDILCVAAVTEALILRLSKLKLRPWPRSAHEAVTVGNDKEPFTSVSCSNIASGEHSPSRIHPHLGQVCEDDIESSKSESCRVLHECV